jgi:hypothetical protein
MAILGIVTNQGLSNAQLANSGIGFTIIPTSFGLSNLAGALDPTRTGPNSGQFFTAPISGRVVVDNNTVKFICTIPPGQTVSLTQIAEVYIYTAGYATGAFSGAAYQAINLGVGGNSIELNFNGSSTNQDIVNTWNTANPSNQVALISGSPTAVSPIGTLMLEGGGTNVLFAIGEANPTVAYDPTGSVTLELQIAILNSNLTSNIVFQFTQATEIAEHNVNPNAHPDIQEALAQAAIFVEAGQEPFSYAGQFYDPKPKFYGLYASVTYHGITFTANQTGTQGNSIALVFDGTSTVNQIEEAWNTSNPFNTVHDSSESGTEILPAGTATLSGGVNYVNNLDLVYIDTDGFYKQALADGSNKSKVVGIADFTYNKVMFLGAIALTTGYPVNTNLYLSSTTPGAITNAITSVQVGVQIYSSPDVILLLNHGQGGGSASSQYAAVVTSAAGLNNYPTTQAAINAVSSGSSILVEIMDVLGSEISTDNKQLNIVFAGPGTGWSKSPGLEEIQLISFSSVPTSGTWRIEWNGHISSDLAFNAPASAVQTAFNSFPGLSGVVVTGNYTSGFTINYPGVGPYVLPTFNSSGQDEVQLITFSAVPNDGCFQIEFLNNPSDTTAFFCYNNTLAQLQADCDAVLGAGNSLVTGSFSAGFTIQYQGTLSLQPIALLQILNNGLNISSVPVSATPSETQAGLRPASNLFNSVNAHVTITPSEIQHGSVIGPNIAIQLTENNCTFTGNGTLIGFQVGFDFNGTTGHRIEMNLDSIPQPCLAPGQIPELNFSSDGSIGSAYSDNAFLRVLAHPTIPSRLIITGTTLQDIQGGYLAQSLNNQLLVYTGNQIDFASGNIYASDGVTIVGGFAPTFPSTGYTWFSLSLQPGATNSDNTLQGALQIEMGVGNASLSAANKPSFVAGAIPLAQAYVATISSAIQSIVQSNIYEVSIGSANSLGSSPPVLPIFQQEVPTGAVNGINNVFNLSLTPKSNTSLLVFVDSLPLPTSQWNLIGTTLTLTTPPATGQTVYVFYVTNTAASVTGMQEVPVGIVNGINPTFSLSGLPATQTSIIVFVDGTEVPITGWTFISSINSCSIQFNAGFIPTTGQDVYVFYLNQLNTNQPTPISAIQNVGAGVSLFKGLQGSIAQFKTLKQGSGVILSDDGLGTLTIQATGGGGGGGGALLPNGLYNDPNIINPSSGILIDNVQREIQWVVGQTGNGGVPISAVNQIQNGTIIGQELILKGTSAADYPILQGSYGMVIGNILINGNCNLVLGQSISLDWNGSYWEENCRS